MLFSSWLFQSHVPPVIPFSLGSLGFLTPFQFNKYKSTITKILENGTRINMRMRFRATVYRAVDPLDPAKLRKKPKGQSEENHDSLMRSIEKTGWCAIEMPPGTEPLEPMSPSDEEVHYFRTRPMETIEFLNDLVVDRGPSPYVSMLEVFADNMHLTTAQADGLCISTPTGSTAYSLSAGGSLVHPHIPAMLITPICPHTLSFRPMQVPDSMVLRVSVPYRSRSNAWASFDGRGRIEIRRGDHVKITASPYPFPTVCAEEPADPWFESVSRTLNWNQRKHQMSFMVQGRPSKHKGAGTSAPSHSSPKKSAQTDKQSVSEAARDSNKPSSARDEDVSYPPGDDEEDEDEDDYCADDVGDDSDDLSEDGFDITDVTPANEGNRSSVWGSTPIRSATPNLSSSRHDATFSMTHMIDRRSPSDAEPETTEGSGVRSPNRYGAHGPPPHPTPLSERHLASVNFRLQRCLDSDAAHAADT